MIITRRMTLLFAALVAMLCLADSATTLAVINSRVGYEANSAIAGLVVYPAFHAFKFVLTVAILYAIHRIARGDPRLELASYVTLLTFYSLIVANNLCVYVLRVGFGFNLTKLFLVFSVIFGIAYGFVYTQTPHHT